MFQVCGCYVQACQGSIPLIEVKRIDSIRGSGLFAAADIPEGGWIVPYLGQRITEEEMLRREVGQIAANVTNKFLNLLINNENYYVDGSTAVDGSSMSLDDNPAAAANNSCKQQQNSTQCKTSL